MTKPEANVKTEEARVKTTTNMKVKTKKALRPFRVKRSSIVCIRSRASASASASASADSGKPKSQQSNKESLPPPPLYLMTEHNNGSVHPNTGTSSTSNSNTKKGKKRNKNSTSSWQWLEPTPNVDDAPLALIGQRVRCILPKSKDSVSDSASTTQETSYSRILEGEVVSTEMATCGEDDSNANSNSERGDLRAKLLVDDKVLSSLHPSIRKGLNLEGDMNMKMKMDQEKIKANDNNNVGTGAGVISKKSAMEQRRRQLELRIQGKEKTMIEVRLPLPTHFVWKPKGVNTNTNVNGDASFDKTSANITRGDDIGNGARASRLVTVVHWFIQKYVQHDLTSGELSEEEQNIRWIIRNHRYGRHLIDPSSVTVATESIATASTMTEPENDSEKGAEAGIKSKGEKLATKFPLRFGEVMDVIPTSDVVADKNEKSKATSTFATVLIRPLGCLEDCGTGRMAHHFGNELVDLDLNSKDADAALGVHNTQRGVSINHNRHNGLIEIPIEDLIVVGKRVRRIDDPHELKEYDWKTQSVEENELMIRYMYDAQKNQFQPLHHEENENNANGVPKATSEKHDSKQKHRTCHRCRVVEIEEKMEKCESKYCGQIRNHTMVKNVLRGEGKSTCTEIMNVNCDNDASAERSSNWWCVQCRKFLRKRGLPVLRRKKVDGNGDKENARKWYGPCCFGSCDCFECVARNSYTSCSYTNTFSASLGNGNGNGKAGSNSSALAQKFGGHQDVGRTLQFQSSKSAPLSPTCLQEGISEFQKSTQNENNGNDNDGNNNDQDQTEDSSPKLLQIMVDALDCLPPTNFSLPFNFLQAPPVTTRTSQTKTKVKSRSRSTSPMAGEMRRSTKRQRKEGSNGRKKSSNESEDVAMPVESQHRTNDQDENGHCDSSPCSRILPHDASKFTARSVNNSAAHARRSLASMRSGGRKAVSRNIRGDNGGTDKKKSSSRAARANQRRLLKDVASFGVVKDNLSGCEHALRFGKSIIHGWGVFSDEHIGAGDLILEYRGVLIGNAVADKREKEYEMAKIGSDYMFRIDGSKVCDATHHGNLARFINASCGPNCYTQIITINGVKRIAIYAKKDINPGDELSYDYKFEPEYDVSERIPCNCGMPECRGFLNWDKRYVAIEASNS